MKKSTEIASRIITDQVVFQTKSGSIQISTDPQGRMHIGGYAQNTEDQLIIDPIGKSIIASSLVVNGTISAQQYDGISSVVANEAIDSLDSKLSADISSLFSTGFSLDSRLSTEISNRFSTSFSLDSKLSLSDFSLTGRISTEASNRFSTETSLTNRISTETSLRSSVETSLDSKLSLSDFSLTGRISLETANRFSTETSLTNRISTETSLRSSVETSLTGRISTSEISLTSRISIETSLRSVSETSLTGRISTSEISLTGRISLETANRFSTETSLTGRISTSETSLTNRISTETSLRSISESSLTGRISTSEISLTGRISLETANRFSTETSLTNRISTETSLRSISETSLTGRISTETANRFSSETSLTSRISTETSLRSLSETSLTGRISTSETSLGSRISLETSNRVSIETSLTGRISAETSLRSVSETSLGSRISLSENVGNSANSLSTLIEGRFTNGLLNATNAAVELRNSNISLAQASNGQITLTLGGSISPIAINPLTTTTFTNVQTVANTANSIANTIESRFTNGLLNTANAAADLRNENLSFTQEKDGTISLIRGGGLAAITANPLSTSAFTNVQTLANTANNTANTIDNRFNSNGKIKSINLADDNDGFKFTTSNKIKIGIGQAQIETDEGVTTQYDSESDIEIVTGSNGIPDIAFLKAQAQGNLTIGQLNFKGWDGGQWSISNPFTGITTTRNSLTYSTRSIIQASIDEDGGGRIDFRTAPGLIYNSFNESPTTTSTRMRIAPNGNVGIATTSPTQKLDINGTVRIRQLVAGTNSAFGRSSSGDITALSSDQRVKKDINTITGSLNLISNLRGVTFKWDNTRVNNFIIEDMEKEKIQIGLIAQEVEQVLPELVYNNGVDDLKSVRYAEMVAVLIESVKELKKEKDQIQNSLLELKIKLSGSNII